MFKHFLLTLALSYSLIAVTSHAEVIDVAAGQYILEEINLPSESMNWNILKIHNSDPLFAPSASIRFLADSGFVLYSIGIVQTDGRQGLSSYISVGDPLNPIKRSAVSTNLELGKNYEFSYTFTENNRVDLVISGEPVSTGIEHNPVKVELMVSGMELSIEKL